MNFKLN